MKKEFNNKNFDNLIESIPAFSLLAVASAMGGMMKMFSLDNEKTPQKLAEEMMAGAVRGILQHFEYKLDELKRDNERKIEEIGKLKEQLEQFKQEKKK